LNKIKMFIHQKIVQFKFLNFAYVWFSPSFYQQFNCFFFYYLAPINHNRNILKNYWIAINKTIHFKLNKTFHKIQIFKILIISKGIIHKVSPTTSIFIQSVIISLLQNENKKSMMKIWKIAKIAKKNGKDVSRTTIHLSIEFDIRDD
jgi:hypothetical protein